MSENHSSGEIVAKFVVILIVAAILLSFIGGVLLQWIFVIPAIAMAAFLAKVFSKP